MSSQVPSYFFPSPALKLTLSHFAKYDQLGMGCGVKSAGEVRHEQSESKPLCLASLVAGAGMGLLSPALTVVVQNSVPVARMGSATTSQQLITHAPALAPAT